MIESEMRQWFHLLRGNKSNAYMDFLKTTYKYLNSLSSNKYNTSSAAQVGFHLNFYENQDNPSTHSSLPPYVFYTLLSVACLLSLSALIIFIKYGHESHKEEKDHSISNSSRRWIHYEPLTEETCGQKTVIV